MGLPGVHSTNISNRVAVSDEILVNGDGSTGLQKTEELAMQLASSGALADRFDEMEESLEGAVAGLVRKATWVEIAAVSGTRNGQPGQVPTTDAGTHTDPVVGGTVPNSGEFSWSTAPAGWRRIGAAIDVAAIQSSLLANATTTAKKARLPNLFTNGNLDPDGAEFTLFDELNAINASYTARSSGTVVIPLGNTILNGLGCEYAINIPANATSKGNRGNRLTQNVNLKGGGIYFSVLVFNFAGGWDFGATGVNSPLATIRYRDATSSNLGLTTFEAVGTNVRRYYGYVALAADKVVSRIEVGLDSGPPRADRFAFTGFWASATSESGLTIGDTEYPDWRSKRNYPNELRNRVTALESSTTLQRFVAALNNDFHSISLCAPGDSITWGLGATGTSPSTPRTGALSDPRNTIDETVSPTWANLFFGYLVRTFGLGSITSPSAGVAEARKIVIGDVCNDKRFQVQDKFTRGPRPKTVTNRGTGPLLLRDMDIPTTAIADDTVVFEFTGDEFTVVHANKGSAVSATYTIEVDGVVMGSTYEHGVGNAWGFTDTVSVAFGYHVVRIWNNSATQPLRLEAVKFNRLFRIRNLGIIGRTTTSWLPSAGLFPGILTVDEFVLMMLGTNDRATAAGQINAGVRIRDNLKTIGAQLKADGKTLILMTPPRAATESDWPFRTDYSFDTQETAMAVRQAAADLGVSYIDNYAATSVKRDSSLVDDGLHLNDGGNRVVFNNIVTSLRLIGQAP